MEAGDIIINADVGEEAPPEFWWHSGFIWGLSFRIFYASVYS